MPVEFWNKYLKSRVAMEKPLLQSCVGSQYTIYWMCMFQIGPAVCAAGDRFVGCDPAGGCHPAGWGTALAPSRAAHLAVPHHETLAQCQLGHSHRCQSCDHCRAGQRADLGPARAPGSARYQYSLLSCSPLVIYLHARLLYLISFQISLSLCFKV